MANSFIKSFFSCPNSSTMSMADSNKRSITFSHANSLESQFIQFCKRDFFSNYTVNDSITYFFHGRVLKFFVKRNCMNSTLALAFGRFFLVCSLANFLANSRTNSCTFGFFWKFSTKTEIDARDIGIILFEDVVLMMIYSSTLTESFSKPANYAWKSSIALTEKKLRENGIATDEKKINILCDFKFSVKVRSLRRYITLITASVP